MAQGKKLVKNKSTKQTRKSARLKYGKKSYDRRHIGRGILGGGGPNPLPPRKPTDTATTEPWPAPGSPEDQNVRKIGSGFKPDELEP